MSVAATHELFVATYGRRPSAVWSAPARVNLIGEHTDYNGGEVLPIAIGQRTYVAIDNAAGSRTRAVSATEAGSAEFDPRRPERTGRWGDYLAGVVAVLSGRGCAVPALDMAVWSDVPAGAGLSSSAALEVAAATAFQSVAGAAGDPFDVAMIAHEAENGFVGVQSGIMDQFASALGRAGHALHIWCDTAATEQVPMHESVLIFDTAEPRSLRGSRFNERRAECDEALRLLRGRSPGVTSLAQATPELVRAAALPAPLDRRALHVSEETRRVGLVVTALAGGGSVPGALLYESHESLRRNYDCSTSALDWFVERAAATPGVRGARLTGAGWGGCAIAVGDSGALEASAPLIAADFEAAFGRVPRSWISAAAGGVRAEPM
ncbi:MAG: galactokinase [Gemmatimonadaceae bacterium]